MPLLFIIIKFEIVNPIHLKHNSRYSVATIRGIKTSTNGGPNAQFDYFIKNKHYWGYADIGNLKRNSVQISERFLIRFYIKNPTNARILFEYKLSDSINSIPKDGWDSIPAFIMKDSAYRAWFN